MHYKKLCSQAIAWLLATTLILANQAQGQQAAPAGGVFYAISGKGIKDTSYLFGTYHLLKDGYLNTLPTVKQHFAKATGLVLETIIDSAALPAQYQKMVLANDSLSGLLDKPFYDSLNTELTQTLGAGASQLNRLKPAAISTMLAMVYAQKNSAAVLDKYTGSPLDVYFANTAKQAGKNITPLETMDQQMGLLFVKPTIGHQVEALKMFLRNKNSLVALGDSLMKAYVDNDLGKMYDIYGKTMEASHEEDYLIKDRNNEWMKTLPGLVQKSKQFIAVGALHLAGPYGLVAQFKNLGYTVTPIKLPK